MTTQNKMQFETFDHVKDPALQTYNRLAMSFNLRDDFGEAVLKEYLSKFDSSTRKKLMVMTLLVVSTSLEEVKQNIMRNLTPENVH